MTPPYVEKRAVFDAVDQCQLEHGIIAIGFVVVATVPSQLSQQEVCKREAVQSADGLHMYTEDTRETFNLYRASYCASVVHERKLRPRHRRSSRKT